MQMLSKLSLSKSKKGATIVSFLYRSSISQVYLHELRDFLNLLSPSLKQIVVWDITKKALSNCLIYQNIFSSNAVVEDMRLELKLP